MPTPAEMPIERLALRFVAAVNAVADRLPRRRRYLVNQMCRAALSVYLNLREGIGEFSAAEKARFYRMSSRSLRECLGCLRVVILFDPSLAGVVGPAAAIGQALRPKLIRYATFQAQRAQHAP